MKNVLLLIAILASSVLNAQTLPSYVPTNGLEAYYSFEQGANDLSGHNHHCVVDGAVMVNDKLSNDSSAYSFDGINDRLNIASEYFNGATEDTVTFRILFKLNSLPSAGNNYVLWNKDGSWTEVWIGINNSGGVFIRWAYNNGYNSLVTNNNQVSPNNWTDLVIRLYNNTGDMVINNVLIQQYNINAINAPVSFSHSGSCGTTNGNHRIGALKQSCNMTGFFDGIIDEFGIWSTYLDSTSIYLISDNCTDTLTIQPQSSTFQTIPGAANFTTAHSDTTATYQWQLNNGTGWTNLSDFGIYSGTTSDSLNLTGITTSLNNNSYRCIIDACTMDTTDVAILTVVDNIGVDESKSNITVSPNPTRGILSIDVRSTTEYKVYNLSGQIVAKGKTEGQIDITNLPTGSYQLIITNEDGRSVHTIQKI